jgi:hypothetical protein
VSGAFGFAGVVAAECGVVWLDGDGGLGANWGCLDFMGGGSFGDCAMGDAEQACYKGSLMNKRVRDIFSFCVMWVLVFSGITLVGSAYWGSGPNHHITVGFTGWLGVNLKYLSTSMVEYFSAWRLGVEVCIAVGMTCFLAAAVPKLKGGASTK